MIVYGSLVFFHFADLSKYDLATIYHWKKSTNFVQAKIENAANGDENAIILISEKSMHPKSKFHLIASHFKDSKGRKIEGSAYRIRETLNVVTKNPSATSKTQANYGGEIVSDEGTPVYNRGVCYGTSANPTTSDDKTEDGAGTGLFFGTLENLTPGTLYHVRAYGENADGIYY